MSSLKLKRSYALWKERVITFRYAYCSFIKLVGKQSKDRAPGWLDKDGWPDETEAQELGSKI